MSTSQKLVQRLWAVLAWARVNGLALVTVVLGIAGWVLLTDVVARWLGGVVWQISIGLLCLSLFGWRFALAIALNGVYTLLKPKRQADR